MDTFHDDNGVIDHNGNRQYESREGEEVEGEPNQIKHKESADQCHGDGHCGNDGRAHIL